MITIKKNGKFSIPDEEAFVGYAGDNLKVTKEILVEGVTDISLVYRIYLLFDDGTSNFFLVDSEVVENGTKLTWNITTDQIYKSGIVQVQIKASNDTGEVFHSSATPMIVHSSIEFSNVYHDKPNSEFLQHEKYLNDLIKKENELNDLANEAMEKAQDIYNNIENVAFDTTPTKNSNRAVTSSGIYSALEGKQNYKHYPIISSLDVLDDMTDISYCYNITLRGGLIEGIPTTVIANLYSFNYAQVIITSYGDIFQRNKDNLTDNWLEFKKVSINEADLDTFADLYMLKNNFATVQLDDLQTVDTLKDIIGTDILYLFTIKEKEFGNNIQQRAMLINNGTNQIVELVDGSKYVRTQKRVGSSVNWSNFEQISMGFEEESKALASKADIIQNVISVSNAAGGIMAGSYTVVGDLCTISATADRIDGYQEVTYSLPYAAAAPSSAIVQGSYPYICSVSLNSNTLRIKRFTTDNFANAPTMSGGTVSFTLTYKI